MECIIVAHASTSILLNNTEFVEINKISRHLPVEFVEPVILAHVEQHS